jgi:ribosome-associated toxin RatA of RatAB toxin-antitoxin module
MWGAFARTPAGAAEDAPDLRPLPEEVLRSYAAALPRGEIALVETDAAGKARQITLLGYAAAPPQVVHALVADPLRYPSYVHNLTRSEVERQADGTLLNHWRFSFPIGSFEGTDEVRVWPGTDAAPGAVTMRSLGEGKKGRSRWEFLPLPGGGTLVVNYGYYDPLDNGFLRLLIGKDPAMDAGFNLAGGLALLRGLLTEAGREARAGGMPVAAPSQAAERAPDFEPLLLRGAVAIVRAGPDGGLVDISVLERVPAPAPQLLALVRQPELWPRFLHMVRRVTVTRRDEAGVDYDMAAAGVFTDVVTSFRGLFVPGGVDTLAVGGAIKGARMRWDIRPDGPAASVAVWRGNLHLSDASRVLRAMLRVEPSFEPSANISVGLISVRSLAAQVH